MLSAEGLGPRTLCMAASHAVACLLLPFASSPAVSFSCVTPSAPGAGYCRDMPVARALPPGGEETAGDPEHPGSHQPRCGSRCRSWRHPAEHATAHHPELSDPPPATTLPHPHPALESQGHGGGHQRSATNTPPWYTRSQRDSACGSACWMLPVSGLGLGRRRPSSDTCSGNQASQ